MGKSRTTFHGKKGRFCGSGNAHTVTKGGERFKVVRQHRRMRRMKPKTTTKISVKKSQRRTVKETIRRIALARERVRLLDHLDKECVSIKELLGV